MESSAKSDADVRIKIFNFEKQKRRERPICRKAPENLIRRAGGLKRCTDLKYEKLSPLFQLWVSYFKSLLSHCNGQMDERLLRMDFHGAVLRVSDSPNKTQIGLYGIVLHESKSTFQMITKRDHVIVIPKEDVTFQFVIANKVFTLFGNALKQRSHLRGKKAKTPKTIPYLLD
ncbi:hypothetical protein ACQ4LE_003838 [Meloidogyne hapla]|uniref:Ribonuclease P protein subunit p29 n=1 Tax=Meloidogyne hapla TaxID=6305 RepID=A0A1I8AX78_MELHA